MALPRKSLRERYLFAKRVFLLSILYDVFGNSGLRRSRFSALPFKNMFRKYNQKSQVLKLNSRPVRYGNPPDKISNDRLIYDVMCSIVPI
jgi:hypothetical protein